MIGPTIPTPPLPPFQVCSVSYGQLQYGDAVKLIFAVLLVCLFMFWDAPLAALSGLLFNTTLSPGASSMLGANASTVVALPDNISASVLAVEIVAKMLYMMRFGCIIALAYYCAVFLPKAKRSLEGWSPRALDGRVCLSTANLEEGDEENSERSRGGMGQRSCSRGGLRTRA